MKLRELLLDEPLRNLLQLYLGSIDSTDFNLLYSGLAKQLSSRRFVVPVYGVQGSGKSTFLNALLFDRPVLPVEADETTCVPVEIAWAAKPSGLAKILYENQCEESVTADDDHLREFVDNALNPGNQRGVTRVVLESDCELLRSGMVLVDLPGIGSLTRRNVETTARFLQEAVGIIFMLRTTPPITQSDSIAIQLVWPRLSYAFFIQNRWNDEDQNEAREGVAHNFQVLREIARKGRISLPSDGPKIHLLNAYQAWSDRLRRESVASEESEMLSLFNALRLEIADWPNVLKRKIAMKVAFDLEHAHKAIEWQIDNHSKTHAQLEQDMADLKRRFDAYLHEVRSDVEASHEEAESFQKTLRLKIQESKTKAQKALKNEMRTKMKAGIVDGKRLSTALEEEQRVAFDEAVGEIQEELLTFADKLKSKFESVKAWRDVSFRPHTVHAEENLKWENLLDPLGGLGGGIGGGIGAAALLVALMSGPPGWAIAGVAFVGGAIGGLFGNWLGNKGREAVLDQRIKSIEPQVFAAIDEFVASVSRQLDRTTSEFIEEIAANLDKWVAEQERAFNRQRKEQLDAIRVTTEEKQIKLISLKKAAREVDSYLSLVKSL